MDMGDYVIVVNADKIVVTGSKTTGKIYYSHSGYLGHLINTRGAAAGNQSGSK